MNDDNKIPDKYDQFIFTAMAVPGSVDMSKARNANKVQRMLEARDRGDHPSVMSSQEDEQDRVNVNADDLEPSFVLPTRPNAATGNAMRQALNRFVPQLSQLPEDDEDEMAALMRDDDTPRPRSSTPQAQAASQGPAGSQQAQSQSQSHNQQTLRPSLLPNSPDFGQQPSGNNSNNNHLGGGSPPSPRDPFHRLPELPPKHPGLPHIQMLRPDNRSVLSTGSDNSRGMFGHGRDLASRFSPMPGLSGLTTSAGSLPPTVTETPFQRQTREYMQRAETPPVLYPDLPLPPPIPGDEHRRRGGASSASIVSSVSRRSSDSGASSASRRSGHRRHSSSNRRSDRDRDSRRRRHERRRSPSPSSRSSASGSPRSRRRGMDDDDDDHTNNNNNDDDVSAIDSSVSHPNGSSLSHSRGRRHRERHGRRSRRHDHNDGRGRRRARSSSTSDSEEQRQITLDNKMEIIRELDKLAFGGVELSFKPTLEMSEVKLRHELERHIANQTLVQRVAIVKGLMKVGAVIVEMVFGTFLKLRNWSVHISRQLDSGQYDLTLEQVYRTIWKRSAPNPWLSLAMLVVGSALMFHFGLVPPEPSDGGGSSGGGGGGGGIGGMLGGMLGGGGGGLGGILGSVMSGLGNSNMRARRAPAPSATVAGDSVPAPATRAPEPVAPPLRAVESGGGEGATAPNPGSRRRAPIQPPS